MTSSCKNREQKDVIYYNKDFNEMTNIAKDIDQPFCIVLVDSLNFTANEYLYLLNNYKVMDRGISYNFINTTLNENKWYSQLLSPQIYPVTCIFNTTGELIDLIPGSSNESILYIDRVIKTKKTMFRISLQSKI